MARAQSSGAAWLGLSTVDGSPRTASSPRSTGADIELTISPSLQVDLIYENEPMMKKYAKKYTDSLKLQATSGLQELGHRAARRGHTTSDG